MVIVHEVKQGSEAWHKLRDKLYTGADSDKLLDHNRKIKIIDGVIMGYGQNVASNFTGNFYTERGHILEDQAIDLYIRLTGHEVIRPGFVTNTKYPHCGYSPDAFDVTLDIPLEVKAFNKKKHLAMYYGEIPLKVQSQSFYGQHIWEKKRGRLIIYNPDFAKKELTDGSVNPDYNPKLAIKIIDLKTTRGITANFHKKLSEAFV